MDIIDIVDRVELFYENAWQKLITTGAIVIGVVGLVVPILIQLWQNKLLKFNESKLKDDIRKEIADIKAESRKEIDDINSKLTKDLASELQHNFVTMEAKLETKSNYLRAMGYHLQGRIEDESNRYDTAAENFLNAIYLYSFGGDTENIVILIDYLVERKTVILNKTFLTNYNHIQFRNFDEYFDKIHRNVTEVIVIRKINLLQKTINEILNNPDV